MIEVRDPKMLNEFLGAKHAVPLCDAAGNVFGHFVPVAIEQESAGREPRIDDAELRRREAQGGGRSLAEILVDLKAGA